MLRTALTLAKKGQAVLACRARDKRPATANGLKDATTDPEIIRQWWQQNPQFNVAIATGSVSGLFVLDVDGLDAEFALRKLEAEHDALPATVEVITARGRHLYFRWPEMQVRNSTGKIAAGRRCARQWRLRIGATERAPKRSRLHLERRYSQRGRSGTRLVVGQDRRTHRRQRPNDAGERLARTRGEQHCRRPARLRPYEARRLLAAAIR